MRTRKQAQPIEKCFQEKETEILKKKKIFFWKTTKMLNALGKD